MKDSTFAILLGFFFIFLVIFIITTDEPRETDNPIPNNFGSFIPFMFLGLSGAVIISYFFRRKQPNDLQSMDQLYWQSKMNQNQKNDDVNPDTKNEKP